MELSELEKSHEDAVRAFDYEASLLRGALLPVERDSLVAKLADGTDMRTASAELGLPLEVVLRTLANPAAVEEIAQIARDAMKIEFMVHGLRRLMDNVRTAHDPKIVNEASKILTEVLGLRTAPADRGRRKPAPPSRAALERAVREAKPS
jgi:hypothetical protein